MKTTHILVAEDDSNILSGLVDTLESEGYQVTPASDGMQALNKFNNSTFDLILIDIMMPGKNGYEVCREIRSKDEDIPIIMLTAKSEEIDKVLGLQLGADDYITKPFGVHELLARISAILRRSRRSSDPIKNKTTGPDLFTFGDAEIDTLKYKISIRGKIIDLSEKEIKLLQLFFSHSDEVLTRDQILNAIWGVNYIGTTRTLDQYIVQLRKKVELDPANPRYIKTIHGVGYRYEK